ncbi:hypothetical protein ACFRKE_13760 [Kitasatospora indigofera]|uniref:hypothetical protein n=1 Tax=Kitasatospora indigofera TaxID=67307 RepID=UPI00368E6785
MRRQHPARPPGRLAECLRAEQHLGRLRTDADPSHTAVVLLALLFGLGLALANYEKNL